MGKKKYLAVALGLLLSIGLTGCGDNSKKADTPKASVQKVVTTTDVATQGQKKDWKIAVVVKDSSNGWFARMEQGVKQYAADTGINAYQKGPASTDAAQQVQVIQDVINQGINALCVVPVDPAACDPVLKEARDKGIIVITHEGSSCKNVDYDLEAFNNAGYGAFIMDKLQESMGGKGVYTTMVAHLTNASQNEWANGAVTQQQSKYAGLKLLDNPKRVESQNNSEKAYQVAKEVLKSHPEVTGFVGTSSMDTPGIARAINELGLKGKAFVVGTGMPNECRSLIKDGSLSYITLWDPAEAGYAMCVMARQILEGKKITDGTDLGLKSYSKLIQSKDNPTLFMGAGWIAINKENVDNYNF
ncbi:autoinducer 2 ABC transporter substrate-binding protein [Sporomusa acidovorans]|uniref:Autoinducer 2-binding protein LsrB n=1 Tax=Sporomusa acidovorans (strain ATCC 49682 / DSM 3132 / Mol) TaxID=1123286 RepID=A0ABZ3JAS5_SPOA4|nr:autoinducer 2 ABC transporter substrate-binding protein [Sporomusa acidovorans]OZC17371.1 autoinducer 2-binding protein LsrB precursor [Sporomusa acidovorans DSM 3132]SDF67864.1 simple sugar transport system substrate-binding protein [Sporomusa acidovorans]